jgi:hypothetical protein
MMSSVRVRELVWKVLKEWEVAEVAKNGFTRRATVITIRTDKLLASVVGNGAEGVAYHTGIVRALTNMVGIHAKRSELKRNEYVVTFEH